MSSVSATEEQIRKPSSGTEVDRKALPLSAKISFYQVPTQGTE